MTDKLAETATAGIEAISALVAERDSLRAENDKLSADAALSAQRLEHLTATVERLSAERDHYMRHSVELLTALNNTSAVIADGLRAARDGAYRPNGGVNIPAPDTSLSPEDETILSRLAARLSPETDTRQ